jgi:uncharacterized protein
MGDLSVHRGRFRESLEQSGVLSQRADAKNAVLVLESNLNLPHHQFWPDSIPLVDALRNVERLTGHRQITDAYLVGLALHRRGKLATFDKAIRAWGIEAGIEMIE